MPPRGEQLPLYGAAAEDLAAEDDDRSPFREDDDVEASDACLWTLRGFSTVTAFAGLLVVVVNAIEIYEFQETPQIYAIRAYAIVFGRGPRPDSSGGLKLDSAGARADGARLPPR